MSRRPVGMRFLDPEGKRYGFPTYCWGSTWMAPHELATRKQLAGRGLRPAGQPVAAQLMWRSRRARRTGGVRTAALYRVDMAAPKRPATRAQLAALGRALLARMTCPACGRVRQYCIPTRYGRCLDCVTAWELDR